MSLRDGIDNAVGCLLVLLFFFVGLPLIGLAGMFLFMWLYSMPR